MQSATPKLVLCLLLTVFAPILPASAASLWDWTYSANNISASGTFTTLDAPDTNGGYLITAITGTRNGETITALQPAGSAIPGNEPYAVDNLVFKNPAAQLSTQGFGFQTADGNYSNPFYASFLPTPVYLEFYSMPASQTSTELPVAFSAKLVSTPEPQTYTLAAIAALLLGIWRRKLLLGGPPEIDVEGSARKPSRLI